MSRLHDKQLCNIKLKDVLEKRRLDQALNVKEFAVAAGISYSVAREWFRLPGFPAFHGVLFWKDFELWRTSQIHLPAAVERHSKNLQGDAQSDFLKNKYNLPPRVLKILREAG